MTDSRMKEGGTLGLKQAADSILNKCALCLKGGSTKFELDPEL